MFEKLVCKNVSIKLQDLFIYKDLLKNNFFFNIKQTVVSVVVKFKRNKKFNSIIVDLVDLGVII